MNDGFGPLEPAASIAKTRVNSARQTIWFHWTDSIPPGVPSDPGVGVGGQQLDAHCGTHVCNVTVSEDSVAKINLKLPKEK